MLYSVYRPRSVRNVIDHSRHVAYRSATACIMGCSMHMYYPEYQDKLGATWFEILQIACITRGIALGQSEIPCITADTWHIAPPLLVS